MKELIPSISLDSMFAEFESHLNQWLERFWDRFIETADEDKECKCLLDFLVEENEIIADINRNQVRSKVSDLFKSLNDAFGDCDWEDEEERQIRLQIERELDCLEVWSEQISRRIRLFEFLNSNELWNLEASSAKVYWQVLNFTPEELFSVESHSSVVEQVIVGHFV